MDNSSYKKTIMPLVAVKEAKDGIRKMLRKKQTLNIGHGVVGMADEFGEVREVLAPFILGHQLTDEIREQLRPELGDFVFYLHLVAKEAKVKMPTATKKLVPKHTLSELVTMVDQLVTANLGVYKKVYGGQPLDMQLIKHNMEELVPLLIQLSWGFLGHGLAELQDQNATKLKARYAEGKFDPAVAAKHIADKKAAKGIAAEETAAIS